MSIPVLAAYLVSKPSGGNLVLLWAAVILFAASTVLAVIDRALYAGLMAAGLAVFVLAFLIS